MTHSTATLLVASPILIVALLAIGDALFYLARIWWPRVRGIIRLPKGRKSC